MSTQRPVHETNESGEDIHVDVDPYIPTGLCAICIWEPEQEDQTAPEPDETPKP